MILVVGGTGRVGRELVRLLGDRGQPVRALVRDQAAAAGTLGAAVELVAGDLRDPDSLAAALDGVRSVFLLSPNEPDQVVLQGNMSRAALAAGVERLVKLSGARPHDDPTMSVGHWHQVTETEIRESGLPFTFLQPNFFSQNFFLYLEDMIASGVLETPTLDGRVACVDTRDVAACAAAVLMENGHEGRTYVLTGSVAVSGADVATAFGEALGRPVTHHRVTAVASTRRLARLGLPDWLCAYVNSLYDSFEPGKLADITDDVQRLIHRSPIPLKQTVVDAVAGPT